MIVGCSKNSNPVSGGLSETQSDGALQYTFSTANAIYKSGDMLAATLTVVNKDSSVVVETDGEYGGFYFALVRQMGGDTVVTGAGYPTLAVGTTYLLPGQPKQIYSINQRLIGTSGQSVPSGLYDLVSWWNGHFFQLILAVQ